jgi:Domain of unknown function (DUF4328)
MAEPTPPLPWMAPEAAPAGPVKAAAPEVGWVSSTMTEPGGPHPYRSASTRARVLVFFLGANAVVSVVAALIVMYGKAALQAFEAGTGGIEGVQTFDDLFGTFGLVELVIATWIAWLAWESRAVDNVYPLGAGPIAFTPNWAMAWWFIPLANLVMPYRVHRDLHRRYGVRIGGWLVLAWWWAYLINNVFGTLVGRMWQAAEGFDQLQTALTMYLASEGLTILAATLAIVLIVGIERRAGALARRVQAESAPILEVSAT